MPTLELTGQLAFDLGKWEEARVANEQIIDAMRLFWERCKLIIEPSAAVSVAAVGTAGGIVAGNSPGSSEIIGGQVPDPALSGLTELIEKTVTETEPKKPAKA